MYSPYELEKIILKNAQQDNLIVFDIDDTLIISHKLILRARALDKFINKLSDIFNCSTEESISLIQWGLWLDNEHLGSGKPASNNLINILQKLIKQKIPVIALTKIESRNINIKTPLRNIVLPYMYEDQRIEDLKKVGINFDQSFFLPSGLLIR